MRSLITFLFIFTIICNFIAQNTIRVVSPKGEVFSLYLNDSVCNTSPQTDVLVLGVKKDTVKLKIKFERTEVLRTVYLLEKGKKVKGKEFMYTANSADGKPVVHFISIYDQMPVKDKFVPDRPVVDTTDKYKDNVLEHYVELKDGKITYFNNFPHDGHCKMPMPKNYMNYLAQLMGRTQTDDQKFEIAELTSRNNCLNVSQLNSILQYISLEIEKLRLIRIAYFSLTDPENRNKLDSTFRLEVTRRELHQFFKNSEEYRYHTGSACEKASEEADVNTLIEKLQVYNSDVEKLAFMRKVVNDHCFSIDHAKKILNTFLHDREKIETCKIMYFHCTEKARYGELLDHFSYNSSKADLNNFLEKQK